MKERESFPARDLIKRIDDNPDNKPVASLNQYWRTFEAMYGDEGNGAMGYSEAFIFNPAMAYVLQNERIPCWIPGTNGAGLGKKNEPDVIYIDGSQFAESYISGFRQGIDEAERFVNRSIQVADADILRAYNEKARPYKTRYNTVLSETNIYKIGVGCGTAYQLEKIIQTYDLKPTTTERRQAFFNPEQVEQLYENLKPYTAADRLEELRRLLETNDLSPGGKIVISLSATKLCKVFRKVIKPDEYNQNPDGQTNENVSLYLNGRPIKELAQWLSASFMANSISFSAGTAEGYLTQFRFMTE